MRLSTFACGAILAATGVQAQIKPAPSQIPQIGELRSQGCYSSKGNLTALAKQIPGTEMSSGSCNSACKEAHYWLSGLHGPQCLCGFALPPNSTQVDISECNVGCSSYPVEACGGVKTYSVFNLGIEIDVPVYDPSTTSTASSSTNTAGPTPTGGSPTSTDPNSPTTTGPTDGSKPEKSGPNVAGIAAGVVVGVVAAAAAIGGFFFYMKRKRNAEIEEEHRRNAAVNAFISGSKPPSSHGSISMTDSRMDPVMAHRRMSDGSIADNEDYSRRILRVTNA